MKKLILALSLTLLSTACGGKSGPSVVTVNTCKQIKSLFIAPVASPALGTGESRQLTAFAIDCNDNTTDWTDKSKWESSNPTIIGVSSAGVAQAYGPGGAQISASYGDFVATAELSAADPFSQGQPTSGTSSSTQNSNSSITQNNGTQNTSSQGKGLNIVGKVSTLAGSSSNYGYRDGDTSSALFNYPADVVWNNGTLYITDYANAKVRALDLATRKVRTIVNSFWHNAWTKYWGIAHDGTNVYVSDDGGNTIFKFIDYPGEPINAMAGASGWTGDVYADFHTPAGLCTDGQNLYVADFFNHVIRKIAIATNQVSILAGTKGVPGALDGAGSSAQFNKPTGLTLLGGNLYVVDYGNHAIRQIEIATGTVKTIAGVPGIRGHLDGATNSALFNNPINITNDGYNLYLTEWGENKMGGTVRKIDLATGWVSTIAGNPAANGSNDGIGNVASFNLPSGITTDGVRLYIADQGNNTIRIIE